MREHTAHSRSAQVPNIRYTAVFAWAGHFLLPFSKVRMHGAPCVNSFFSVLIFAFRFILFKNNLGLRKKMPWFIQF